MGRGSKSVSFSQEQVPSYEDAIRMPQSANCIPLTRPAPITMFEKPDSGLSQDFSVTMAAVREQRIQRLIDDHLLELLDQQVSDGQNYRVYLFIPSEWKNLVSTEIKNGRLVNKLISHRVRILRGEENTGEFWQQPKVLEELSRIFKTRLFENGHRVADFDPKLSTSLSKSSQLKSSFWRSSPLFKIKQGLSSLLCQGDQPSQGLTRTWDSKVNNGRKVTGGGRARGTPAPVPVPADSGSDQNLKAGEIRINIKLNGIFVTPVKPTKGKETLSNQALQVEIEIGG